MRGWRPPEGHCWPRRTRSRRSVVYTPEEAGLEVFFERGRWFAVWRRLEVPEGAPEAERWEVLRLEENPEKPGTIVYLEV